MAEKEIDRSKGEIDLFDFLEIIARRKYLVISIFTFGVLVASFYSYLQPIIHEAPPRYSIHMLIRHPKTGLDVEVVRKWFESGAYKGYVQEAHNQVDVPDIKLTQRGGDLLELSMLYPEAGEGKVILRKAAEALETSELGTRTKEGAKELIEKQVTMKRLELKILNEKINGRKASIINREGEVHSIRKKIADVTAGLRELNELRSTLAERQKNRSDSVWQYYDCLKGVIRLLVDLESRVRQAGYDILIENERLGKLNRELAEKGIELGGLERDMRAIKVFGIEHAAYASLVPSKSVKKVKIMAIGGIAGLFIGCFIGVLLEIKSRRHS